MRTLLLNDEVGHIAMVHTNGLEQLQNIYDEELQEEIKFEPPEHLYPWQDTINRIVRDRENGPFFINNDPHFIDNLTFKTFIERQIVWIYDERGNAGKSVMCQILQSYHHLFYCLPTDHRNMSALYAQEHLRFPNGVVFDVARGMGELKGDFYSFLENVKDGIIVNTKYQTRRIITKKNKFVFVMANVPPQKQFLSLDRFIVLHINSSKEAKFVNIDELP